MYELYMTEADDKLTPVDANADSNQSEVICKRGTEEPDNVK